MQPLPRLLALVALIAACGKKSPAARVAHDAAAKSPAVAPLAMPALGVDRVDRFNFVYGDGAPAYEKALAARRGKTPDWGAVRTACEAALAKDPMHLDAQWLLGIALAQTGEPAAAVDHLVAAIAADEGTYGAAFTTEPALAGFRATPHGQAVAALAGQIHAEIARRVKTGLWLLGRRTDFHWPARPGVQPGSSRGELYAYDRESRRYLRLSHTSHHVAAFLRALSGKTVALLGFDRIDHSKDDTAPPLLARAWVEQLDTTTWKRVGRRAHLPSSREVSIGFGANDQLLVTTAPASGRWTVGDPTVWAVDAATGKLARVGASPPMPRVVLSLEEGGIVRVPQGIVAAWSNEPPTTPSLKTPAGVAIQVPESGQASQATVAAAPDGGHVAFATAVDPCSADTAPSLYVADAKTGALKHLFTARSRFATEWLDATTLAYEDGDGAIRLWSTTTGRQLIRLAARGGLALDVLAVANGEVCKQAPPAAAPAAGSAAGSAAGAKDEPMPPEVGSDDGDGGGAGPVTQPQ